MLLNQVRRVWWYVVLLTCWPLAACAGGGPLGIDHMLSYDDHGIWARRDQLALVDGMVLGEAACGLAEGVETELGKTCWQSIDASLAAALATTLMKPVFGRPRPSQGNDPNLWFQGSHYQSFPSGEVAAVSSIVTPFVLKYQDRYPAVWLLEALPVYDALARMKVHGHWQTDVLGGFAIGTGAGVWAARRDSPFSVSLLPHGVAVGMHYAW